MYLSKKTYIGANYKHNNVKGKITLTKEDAPIGIKLERVTYIDESVGYWRKANHIHNWFVTHCQDGVDDCKEYDVSKENLLKLLSDCKEVKENIGVAEEVMPTTSGFFFGGTDYDEYYMQEIDKTIEIVEQILLEAGEDDYLPFEITYQSSW